MHSLFINSQLIAILLECRADRVSRTSHNLQNYAAAQPHSTLFTNFKTKILNHLLT